MNGKIESAIIRVTKSRISQSRILEMFLFRAFIRVLFFFEY